jgi:hypothetical protein
MNMKFSFKCCAFFSLYISMMALPTWLPWTFVGGFVFMLLSFIAAKYNDRNHATTAFAQDFISGGIVIALLGALVPDYFPTFPISSSDIPSISLPTPSIASGGWDLQVGPLRR